MYQAFDIGKRFRIVPPDTTPSSDGKIDLVMHRGAFGSGEHVTTASCLEILETLDCVKGARVLDLGSGTGILAIAAIKLGATSALCVDIEPAAVASAEKNCRLNGIGAEIEHRTGTLDAVSEEGFDLVLANIYGDILIALADQLAPKAKPGGQLLLSGILWEYNFDVRQAYLRNDCDLVSNQMLEEFSTVVLRKESGSKSY
jgi:ribosomal protein L11 methyltransferase